MLVGDKGTVEKTTREARLIQNHKKSTIKSRLIFFLFLDGKNLFDKKTLLKNYSKLNFAVLIGY